MIFGIGTDIIEVERIQRFIAKGDSFKNRVFTPDEIAYCDSYRYSSQYYAVRFAAKEAFVKALGTGFTNGIDFNQIEVAHDEQGKPFLNLSGKAKEIIEDKGITAIHVSLTHIKEWANAVVVLENSGSQ